MADQQYQQGGGQYVQQPPPAGPPQHHQQQMQPVQVQYVQHQQHYQQQPEQQVVYQQPQPQYTRLVIQPQGQPQPQQQQPVVIHQPQQPPPRYQYQQQPPQHYQQQPQMQQQHHQQQHYPASGGAPQPMRFVQVQPQQGSPQRFYKVNGAQRFQGRQILVLRPANSAAPGNQQFRVQHHGSPQRPQQAPQQQAQVIHQQHPHGGGMRMIRMQAVPSPNVRQQIRVQMQQQRPRIINQYQQQRPPQPPPQQQVHQQGQGEIMLNVEHQFNDNGKVVRKMPIKMGNQVMWVDCADEQELANANDSKNNLVLDLDTNIITSTPPVTSTSSAPPMVSRSASSGEPTKRTAKDFTPEEVEKIVHECTVELVSPAVLAGKYQVNVTAIRDWVKKADKKLPSKYSVTSSKEGANKSNSIIQVNKPMNSPAQANQSLLTSNVQANKDETITLYAGQPAPQLNNSHSPPAQIVRHPGQLLVTDNKTGQAGQNMPGNQLQLPQRPMPPGLPKPVAAVKVQEVHKPKLIPGKVALCPNCGGFSVDISKCTGCRKIIKEGCKIMNDPDYKPPPGENEKKILITGGPSPDLRNVRIQPKQRRKTANEEPECIALSSDEENEDESPEEKAEDGEAENDTEKGANKDNNQADPKQGENGESGGNSKKDGEGKKDDDNGENSFKAGPGSASEPRFVSLIKDLQTLLDGNQDTEQPSQSFASLSCRSIRVGSYKILTKDRVFFTQKAIYLKVPFLTDSKKIITLVIPSADILKIEMLSGRSMPLLFISTTPSTCDRIRKDLNLNFKQAGLYYDLSSSDETMKRITMLPDKMPEEVKNLLNTFYGDNIVEMDGKTANEMLVKSTPKSSSLSFQTKLQNKDASVSAGGQNENKRDSTAPAKIEKYCQFPSAGSNTVSVTQEDYFCLEDESFLNDVIIDFYFKWIQEKIVPLESREKTHIFSTYFYKRLTTRPPRSKNKLHPIEDDVNLSNAEKRYERVRRWTKKVNIFEKDFVVVPINEHSHWFVAVICYPGLVGKTNFQTGEAILEDPDEAAKAKKVQPIKKKVMQIGSTSIIPLKSSSNSFHLDDDSDKDEADASDSEMVVEDDSDTLSIFKRFEKKEEEVKDTKKEEKPAEENDDKTEENSGQEAKPEENQKEAKAETEEASSEKKTDSSSSDDKTEAKNDSNCDPEPKADSKEAEGDSTQPECKADEKEKTPETDSAASTASVVQEPQKAQVPAVKQPCILIFDSLQTGLRSRVVATLREYLQCEYKAKMNGQIRKFNKDNMKGACPKVPQQPNFSDCGLFALQYVESFFKAPIQDFELPIKNLRKWFPSDVMRNKRSDIAKIIRNLAEEQNKDKKLSFPPLTFTPESGSGYTDDEDEDSKPVNKALKTPKFFVKTASGSSATSATTATKIICLTSSKSLTLTPATSSKPVLTSASSTPVKTSGNGGQLMIQRKKGKFDFFTLKEGKKTQTRTVVIPKLTASPVSTTAPKKDQAATNGPSSVTSKPSSSLVNYSDSSSEDSQKLEPNLDMDVDEDGAPMLKNLPKPVPSKRPAEPEADQEDTSKKAKVDEPTAKEDQSSNENKVENDA